MEIRIKPIKANEWSGITRYPNCNDYLGPYFTRSGSIYTGLTKEDADRLGDLIGEDLRPNSEFWTRFRVRIGTETIVLDTDKPEDELKFLFLKNHKRVKDSIHAFKSTANYYLSNPEEEANVYNEYNRTKRTALKEFDKLKPEDIKKCLRLYGYRSENISDSVAEDRLFTLVESNPKNFMEKWVDNKHRATEFLIKEAVAKQVIRKTKNTYAFGNTTLGHTLEETILFIDNPENSDIKAAIVTEAKIK